MTIAQYSKIEFGDYNGIALALIQNMGSGPDGMGYATATNSVSPGDKVKASDLVNLRTDLAVAFTKCFNSSPNAPTVGQNGLITYAAWNSYATDKDSFINNKLSINAAQADVIANSISTTPFFNVSYSFNYTFTWSGSAAFAYFFNQGGSLRFNAGTAEQSQTPYAGTSKALAYQNMLNQVGTINIGNSGIYWGSGTSSTSFPSIGVGSTVSVMSVSTSGNYPSNTYVINVGRPSAQAVSISASFADVSGANPSVDEQIRFTGASVGYRTISSAFSTSTGMPRYLPTIS